jgi:hypothetical protein
LANPLAKQDTLRAFMFKRLLQERFSASHISDYVLWKVTHSSMGTNCTVLSQ